MSKLYALILFCTSFGVFSQTNNLRLDSAFHRMGVDGFFENGLTYYKAHLYEPQPVNYSGLVTNIGSYDLTGCHLLVEAYDLFGELVYQGSSDTVTIAVGETDSLYLDLQHTFVYQSEYDVYLHVKSDSIDDNTANDSVHYPVEITPYTVSRSNGEIEGSILIGPEVESPYIGVGNVYEGIQYHQIERVSVPIIDTSLNQDQVIFAEVFWYHEGDELWNYMDRTMDHLITESDLGNAVELIFSGRVDIEFGEVFMISIKTYSRFLAATSQSEDLGTVFYTTSEGTIDTLIDPHAITMDLHSRFGGLADSEASIFSIQQNRPNPFSEGTLITYELSTTETVALQISDISGRRIETISKGAQHAGTHQITLDTRNWESGLYFYTLTVGNKSETKTMVKH